MIEIKEGKIINMNAWSGHYKQNRLDFYNAIKKMEETMPEAFHADANVRIGYETKSVSEFLAHMEEASNVLPLKKRYEIMIDKRKAKNKLENKEALPNAAVKPLIYYMGI